MAIIHPFKGIRATADKVHLFVSRSLATYNNDNIKQKLDTNPYSFIHIIKPIFDKQKITKKPFSDIKKKINQFLKNEIIKQEKSDSFYLYEQKKGKDFFTGLISIIPTSEIEKNNILLHEKIIKKRLNIFAKYLKKVKINAEPILLAYKKNDKINSIYKNVKKNRPIYDFTTTDKINHKLWIINDKKNMNNLISYFNKIDKLYVSDGHHRLNSSLKVNSKYFMSCLIQEDNLKIYSFNRILQIPHKINIEQKIKKLSSKYTISIKETNYKLKKENEIGIYYENKYYSLKYDLDMLNIEVISKIIPVFSTKNSISLKYISSQNSQKDILKKCKKNEIIFFVKPVKFKKIKDIAEQHKHLPPKSTYILPKLRSGLVLYKFK
tara:strand:+ start:518 stop:1654 length:1137 start_codon:yes stop_codon:yes gene_type:complete